MQACNTTCNNNIKQLFKKQRFKKQRKNNYLTDIIARMGLLGRILYRIK